MAISSRTPEGSPGTCPVCGSAVVVEPSQPFGDAPCPACGTLLWFTALGHAPRFFDSGDAELAARLAERLGVDPEALLNGRWDELGLDSLDVAEFLLDLEG